MLTGGQVCRSFRFLPFSNREKLAEGRMRGAANTNRSSVMRIPSRRFAPTLSRWERGNQSLLRLSLQCVNERLQFRARVALILERSAEEMQDLLERGNDVGGGVGDCDRTGGLFPPLNRGRLFGGPLLHLARHR